MTTQTANSLDKQFLQIAAMIEKANASVKSGAPEEAGEVAKALISRLDDRVLMSGDMSEPQKRLLTSQQTQAATVLRKLGFVDDALKLCRRAFAAIAADIWVVRAYGWALCAAIKKAKHENNEKAALDLVLEFDRLQIPDAETLLLQQRAHYHVGLVGTEQHLADAFRLARQRYRDYPQDSRAVQNYFWVLADCIEQAVWMKKLDLAKQFYGDIVKLSTTDDKQKNKLLHLKAELDPTNALRQEADAFSKKGDHVKAASLYREALRIIPTSRESQQGLGWSLFRLLKEELKREKPDSHKVKEMFREYLSLEHVDKPSVLHSLILNHATRNWEILGDLYPSFVIKWGVENLREEDYLPYKPEGKDEAFPGLAERMGMALGKVVKSFKRKAVPKGVDPVLIRDVLAGLVKRLTGHQWLPYHYAKTLILTGDLDAARAALLPIVRSKPTEFWVWSALADTFARRTPERLACLSRAALCRVRDKEFLKGVLSRLRSEFQNVNELDAVGEIEKIVPDRRSFEEKAEEAMEAREKSLEEDAEEAMEALDKSLAEDAEEAIEKLESSLKEKANPIIGLDNTALRSFDINNPLLGNGNILMPSVEKSVVASSAQPAPEWKTITAACEKYAPMAEEIVLGGVPWMDALVSGRMDAKAGAKGFVFVLYAKGDSLAEARVRNGKYSVLDDARIGSPVAIRISQVEGRDLVVSARPREGREWDLLPEKIGVVKNVNPAKGVTAIAIGPDEFTLAYFDHFPAVRQLLPGQIVSVRLQPSRTGVPPRLVSLGKSEATPAPTFYRVFEGAIRINSTGGFGFIEDVYVPRHLLDTATINGARIAGSAVLELNQKTGKKGWRALIIKT